MTVERVEDVEAAIDAGLRASTARCVIDFRVEREVNVFPMVPQGKSIGEMILEAPEPVVSLRQLARSVELDSGLRRSSLDTY